MADTEIESFVQKFKSLRGAGLEATLTLDTKLGEVWITMNCKVGRNIPPPPSEPSSPSLIARKIYRSPSYFRRQLRRKAEREAKESASSAALAVADTNEKETAEKAVVVISNEVAEMPESTTDDSVADCEAAEFEQNDSVNVSQEIDTSTDDENLEPVEVDQPQEDLGLQLENLIQQSQKNRELWDKSNGLPS